jgi:hypothetical protein
MDPTAPTTLQDLPLEVLTDVCQRLGLRDILRLAATCKRLRHGDGGIETAELPTKSPVVTALRALAFPRPDLVPNKRPMGCSESWVTYLIRVPRQRLCREAPPFAVAPYQSLFVDAAGRLLACGPSAAVGRDGSWCCCDPTPVAALAGVRVRIVATGDAHSLAFGWNGRVYSWGSNYYGQLGDGNKRDRREPKLVKRLEGVCSVAAGLNHSLAATESGAVFGWGMTLPPDGEGTESQRRPIIVEGFEGVRVRRRVFAGQGSDIIEAYNAFAIGEAGELFSWGFGEDSCLGHSDEEDQPSPKRVEALRGVRVSSVSVGMQHALALAEDGLVYSWGVNTQQSRSSTSWNELLPTPVEALRGVRVGSIAAGGHRSYAVATGEVWAWGWDDDYYTPLGHDEEMDCPVPKPIEALRGVKVDAVAATDSHTLALADDGVYTRGVTRKQQHRARSAWALP